MASSSLLVELTIQARNAASGVVRQLQGELGELDAQAGGLTGTLARASGAMQSVGMQAMMAGGALTAGLTVPIAAAGGAVIKMAADYQESLLKVQGLAGASATEVQNMSSAILNLAQTVPVAPDELAKGLYFLESAGYSGADAMNILNITAKASAAGMGNFDTVADAVTSTLNAYGRHASDAAHVTDVLMETIVKGKMAPEDLANSLGMVVSTSAGFGVSIEEMGANIATLTHVGINAHMAATALNNALLGLEAPTTKTSKALAEIGRSAASVRDEIRSKGLLATMQDLYNAEGGQIDKLRDLFPNMREFRDLWGTVGTQMPFYKQTLDGMNNSMGATERAFQVASQGFSFQLHQLENDFRVAGIEIGNAILPKLTPLIEKISGFVRDQLPKFHDWLTKLNPKIIDLGLAIAGVAIAAGPVVGVIGGILFVIGALMTTVGLLALAITGLGIGIAALGVAWATNWGGIRDKAMAVVNVVKPLVEDFATTIKRFFENDIKPAIEKIYNDTLPQLQKAWDTVKDDILPAVEAIRNKIMTDFDQIRDFLQKHGDTIKAVIEAAWKAISTVIGTVLQVVADLIDAGLKAIQGNWKGAWDEVLKALSDTGSGIKTLVGQIVDDVISAFEHLGGQLYDKGRDAIQGFIDGMGSMLGGVISQAASLAQSAISTIAGFGKSPWPDLIDKGSDAAQGFIDGMAGRNQDVIDTAGNLAQLAINASGAVISGNLTPSMSSFLSQGQAVGSAITSAATTAASAGAGSDWLQKIWSILNAAAGGSTPLYVTQEKGGSVSSLLADALTTPAPSTGGSDVVTGGLTPSMSALVSSGSAGSDVIDTGLTPGMRSLLSGGTSSNPDIVSYDRGGRLPEDIVGFGPSGQRYRLHANETVVPVGHPVGGGTSGQGTVVQLRVPVHLPGAAEPFAEYLYEFVIDKMGREFMRQVVS